MNTTETLTVTPEHGPAVTLEPPPDSRTYENVYLPCGSVTLMHIEPFPLAFPGGPVKITSTRAGISTPLGTWKVQRHTPTRLTLQYLHP